MRRRPAALQEIVERIFLAIERFERNPGAYSQQRCVSWFVYSHPASEPPQDPIA